MIKWDEAEREWRLDNGRIGWAMRVLENGWLGHLHAGASLGQTGSLRHLGPEAFHGFANRVGEPVALELPAPDVGDFRFPGLEVRGPDGATVLDLAHVGQRILRGKPALPGLPSTYAESDDEAETLEIDLEDRPTGLRATVRTTLFAARPIVARSLTLTNTGTGAVDIKGAMSAVLDLPDAAWDLVTLSGRDVRERQVVRRPLVPGRQSVGSRRGSSGHEHSPFLVVCRTETTEDAGEAFALILVYSGNFVAEAEVEPFHTTRVRIGINPDGFSWRLEPGASFTTPEAIVTWSSTGLGGVSEALHDLFRTRLARGPWRDRPRPVVLNNWEATYFEFDHERLLGIARAARDLGIEAFVLDDGWFGKRDDDRSSLGDWVVDRRKLPRGLDALAADVHDLGLAFGPWIEPEMVSPDSDLFRAHPDWAIGPPGRDRIESRNQLVLDLARPEVVDHLATTLIDVLSSAPIDILKWDMNRYITGPWSASLPADRQGELAHRHVLGVYELYRRIIDRFPDLLIESCAAGGGRFDAGMLAYAPQAWTSDNTDAVGRLGIQWGTSLAFPLSSVSAHVSAVPNHQVGRTTPLFTRAAVAMFGAFGYELDPGALSVEEQAEVACQVAWYQDHRVLFQFGRFHRLRSPFAGDRNETAWMVTDPGGQRALAGFYRVLARPAPVRDRLRLRGLDPAARYRVATWSGTFAAPVSVVERAGSELMAVGVEIEPAGGAVMGGDFSARLFELDLVAASRDRS